jgi:hypothetical protein
MTAPLPLVVPAPLLAFKAVAATFAPLEGAVVVSFPAVRFPDGDAMTADDFRGAEALLIRASGPAALPEVWDPALRSWRPAAGADLSRVGGVPLVPPKSGAAPWEGVLAGAGQKDAAGAPLLDAAVGGFPRYRLRGAFRAKRGEVEAFGLGPESAAIEFASTAATSRFAAQLEPDPEAATRALRARAEQGARAEA